MEASLLFLLPYSPGSSARVCGRPSGALHAGLPRTPALPLGAALLSAPFGLVGLASTSFAAEFLASGAIGASRLEVATLCASPRCRRRSLASEFHLPPPATAPLTPARHVSNAAQPGH